MRQWQYLADLVAALLEDLDVGVQEAVDRLELVADEEQLVAGDEVDQLALQPVRVLELVDADLAEAELLARADLLVVAQQVAGSELEVVVVERRLAVLRLLVAALEAQQQLLEQLAVARGDGVQRRLLDRVPRLLVLVVALDRVLAEVEQRLGGRVAVEQLDEARGVLVRARGRSAARSGPTSSAGRRAERKLERAPGGPQRLVHAGQHPPQRLRAVGGEQREPLGLSPEQNSSAPRRTPRRGSTAPGPRRARGTAGRARRRTGTGAAGACRSRGSSRSRRRRARASARAGRARRAACESARAARPQHGRYR